VKSSQVISSNPNIFFAFYCVNILSSLTGYSPDLFLQM
jgi:hypothetical protein